MEQDLKRDVIKSDTASVEIPELELELSHGSLGGVYTTVRPYDPTPSSTFYPTTPGHGFAQCPCFSHLPHPQCRQLMTFVSLAGVSCALRLRCVARGRTHMGPLLDLYHHVHTSTTHPPPCHVLPPLTAIGGGPDEHD